MKTERRHELQTNQLADLIGSTVETAKPFTKIVAGALVAIAVIVGATWYLNRQSAAAQAEGWDLLNQASSPEELQNVATQYAGTPAGTWARMRLADVQLGGGVEALFNDRAEANSELRRAKDNYNQVLNERGASELAQQRAAQGVARAAEALNELPAASEMYQTIIERWPDSAFADMARRRVADLDRRSTQEFYDWFALQDPKPPADDEPSAFGNDSAFDFGLPDEPGEMGSVFGVQPAGTTPPSDQPILDETRPQDEAEADASPPDDAPAESTNEPAEAEEPEAESADAP